MEEKEFDSFVGKLGDYEKALQEEYKIAESNNDIDTIRKLIETKIARALPGFVDDLVLIARAGDTDASRLKAISFAFNWYFKESTSADDPFSVLLKELTKVDENPHLRTPAQPPTDPTQLDITGGTNE